VLNFVIDFARRREDCRLCGSTDLRLVLPLTPTPPANAFVEASCAHIPQRSFPLDVFFCRVCHHVQLLDVVDPRVLFENYVYVSGTSPVFVRHFQDYAQALMQRFAPKAGSLVVDIGSNDGTMLRFFKEAGFSVLGIDPATRIASRATAEGIETLPAFFDRALANTIVAQRGTAALVVANNVFAHADNLAEITDAISDLLAPEGVFAFEVSYLLDVVEKTLFDTIYHEHLDYHGVAPLKRFFAAHGLDLFAAERVQTHGGSLRGYVQRQGGTYPADGSLDRLIELELQYGLDRPETFVKFALDIERKGRALRALIDELRGRGMRVAGYGAPAKATTFCHHFGLGADMLEYVVDDSPLKQGLLTPGIHIPVVPASVLENERPDYLVILAWNFAETIIEKLEAFRAAGGKIVVPLPELKIC